jgi:hypothetical protein
LDEPREARWTVTPEIPESPLDETQDPTQWEEKRWTSTPTPPPEAVPEEQEIGALTTGTKEKGSDEDSEESEEYTDDEELDDIERYTITYDVLDLVRKMIDLINAQQVLLFPVVAGKRRLDPMAFDHLQGQMRKLLWHYRLVNIDYDAYSFV